MRFFPSDITADQRCYGSGGGGSQTVTQVQQIPEFEQQYAQENQDIARSLASQAYPTYQAPLIAGFSGLQEQALGAVPAVAASYQPDLTAAEGTTANALSLSPGNPGAVSSYMSPFIEAALQPQVQDLQTQLGQQQRQIDAQATQSGAFGDARQGVESALANYYGDQALSGVIGQGYNTAFQNAQGALLQEQQAQMQGGAQLGTLGGLNQQLGLTGANAIFDAGSQEQQLQQQALNAAYQQYQNQVNWPYQMLNVRLSSLSNSPYSISNSTTLPSANMTAQGLGSFAALAGGLGSLMSGGSSGASKAPFGGSAL